MHGREIVGIVQMEQRAVEDCLREVERPAAIRDEFDVGRAQAPVGVVADTEPGMERMPLAGELQVKVAIELDARGPPGLDRRQRHERRHQYVDRGGEKSGVHWR